MTDRLDAETEARTRDSRAEARKAKNALNRRLASWGPCLSANQHYRILEAMESLARREYEEGFKAGVIAVKEFPREWGVTVAQVQARHEARRRG